LDLPQRGARNLQLFEKRPIELAKHGMHRIVA